MDRRILLEPVRAPSRSFLSALLPTTFVILVCACFRAAPEPLQPLPPAAFTVLKQRVAQIRNLPFKQDVQLAAAAASTSDEQLSGLPSTDLEFVYRRIGLLPENGNLASDLAEYERWKRLITYEAQTSTLVISPQTSPFGSILAPSTQRRADQVPTVLALARALQEQHYGWQERLRSITVEDRTLAFDAVAYGDAILLAQSHIRGNESRNWAEDWQAILNLCGAIERSTNRLPDVLREKLIFPYREGSQFVNWALASNGWQGVDGLFDSPPLSSAQILHPERYYNEKEPPRRILPLGVIRRLPEPSSMDQTLGEFLIRVILTSQFSREQSTQLASSWRGDYLSTFGAASNQPTIVWYSNWRDDVAAENFMQAFKTILERRHRTRFQRSAEQRDYWTASLRSGRSAVLQRNGSTVAWLEGQTNELFRIAAADLWSDLEITAETVQLPFDSAGWSGQLSRTRR